MRLFREYRLDADGMGELCVGKVILPVHACLQCQMSDRERMQTADRAAAALDPSKAFNHNYKTVLLRQNQCFLGYNARSKPSQE